MVDVLKVGDPVKFAHPNGSTGRVVNLRTDGPFRDDPAIIVRWYYGKDVRGDDVTATSSYYGRSRYNLVRTTEEDLRMVMERKFNSNG